MELARRVVALIFIFPLTFADTGLLGKKVFTIFKNVLNSKKMFMNLESSRI
jgi:hypothetical protein